MTNPKQLWLPGLVLVLVLLGAAFGPVIEVSAHPQAQGEGWHEVSRAKRGSGHIWKHVNYAALNWSGPCGRYFCPYRPGSGSDVGWWQLYHDSRFGWGVAESGWYDKWPSINYNPVPGFGKTAFGGDCAGTWCPNGITSLMRAQFRIPEGYVVTDARLRMFGDNMNEWFINGHMVEPYGGHWSEVHPNPAIFNLNEQPNIIAGAVYNDNSCAGCNPYGMHYILSVYLERPSPPDAPQPQPSGCVNPDTTFNWNRPDGGPGGSYLYDWHLDEVDSGGSSPVDNGRTSSRQVSRMLARGDRYEFTVRADAVDYGVLSDYGRTEVGVYPRIYDLRSSFDPNDGVRFEWSAEGMDASWNYGSYRPYYRYELYVDGQLEDSGTTTQQHYGYYHPSPNTNYELRVWASNVGCEAGPVVESYVTPLRPDPPIPGPDGCQEPDVAFTWVRPGGGPDEPYTYPWQIGLFFLWTPSPVYSGEAADPLRRVQRPLERGGLYEFWVYAKSSLDFSDVGRTYVMINPRVYDLQAQEQGGGVRFTWSEEGFLAGSPTDYYAFVYELRENGLVIDSGQLGYDTHSYKWDPVTPSATYTFKVTAERNYWPYDLVCSGSATVTYTAPAEDYEVEIPEGDVFIHAYQPGADDQEQADFATDTVIRGETQRWLGLAPIYDPAISPQLCGPDPADCTDGDVATTHFELQRITHLSAETPSFEYPNGNTLTYLNSHTRGSTNYDVEEYLWLMVLSAGGNMPATPDGGVQAVAEEGRPGTYKIEGVLHMKASWTTPLEFEHEWSIPITFYVGMTAPAPQGRSPLDRDDLLAVLPR